MNIREIHEILQEKLHGKVTQNDIARAIGTSRANVSKLFQKNSVLNFEKIKKIEEYFEIKFENDSNYIVVDYYPNINLYKEKSVKCKIPTAFFNVNKNNTRYIMCHAQGNSMYPVIWDNDIVIIEEANDKQITNNKIYAFLYEDVFYINRLAKNINQYIVQPENKDYPVQYIEKQDMPKLKILGKVVYVGKSDNL